MATKLKRTVNQMSMNPQRRRYIFAGVIVFNIVLSIILVSAFDFSLKKPLRAMGQPAASNSSQYHVHTTLIDTFNTENAQFSPNQLNQAFIRIAESVTSSIVTIHAERIIQRPQFPNFPLEDFFSKDFFQDDFFGRDYWDRFYPEREYRQKILGSGVIVREDGYILTNNHVVAQGEEITITLSDGTTHDVVDIETDPPTDLALIRIEKEGLSALPFGDSDKLRVGEWVLAVGNPFAEELRQTVTAGIISAKGRTNVISGSNHYENFIQTDAAINPGNSGGALINLSGELVGINTAIASNSGGFQGIGFAIPINMAKRVMRDLLEEGQVIRAYLGTRIQELDNDMAHALNMEKPRGAMVVSVASNTPADKAGLKAGDVILQYDGKAVKSVNDLRNKVANSDPGSEHSLTILRQGRTREISVKLTRMPENLLTTAAGESNSDNFGFSLANLTAELREEFDIEIDSGVVIIAIQRGSQAAKKGIEPGSVITEVGIGNAVTSLQAYRKTMQSYKPGDAVVMKIYSRGIYRYVGFTIPDEDPA